MNSEDSSSNWELEKQIDRICEAFEKSLRAGMRPKIADHLGNVSEQDQGKVLRELLLLEWEHCDTSKIQWSVDSYVDEFPRQKRIIQSAAVDYQGRLGPESTKDTDLDFRSHEDTDLITLASLRQGREVGQYVLEEKLGAGGIGIVFLARQLRTDRRVALKFLNLTRCDPQKRTELRERFLQEPKAVARLQHDHIVTVYEADEQDGVPFFSMQLIEGPSLRALTAEGPIDCRQAATYIRDVADAIEHAHKHKVLHRDIKPGNVLVGPDERPYVTDFGMAKLMVDDVGLTQEGRGLGTVSYVSPEQAANAANVDERSDIYGIGATLYCLITGRPPFQAATTGEILAQVQMMDPVAPRQLNPIIDRDLETICLKCLAKTPEHRYSSAHELTQDIVRYLEGAPILARPVGVPTRTWRWLRRRPALSSALALAACLVLLPSIAGPLWALRESEFRTLRDKDFARSTVDGARLKIQVGEWQDAIRLCEESSALPVENRTEVVFIASDALAALGSVERRASLLAQLEPADLTPEQGNRLLLDLADTARLAGQSVEYQNLLGQVDVAKLGPADRSYVEALKAESLEASIPHLESALRHDSWHFEAFTELLAALLLLDEVEKLDMLTLDSNTRYKEDPSTHVARALAAAAGQNEPFVEELLARCQQELSPGDAKTAESLVRLFSATRKVEVPWHTQLRKLQHEVDSHLSQLHTELAQKQDNRSRPTSRLIKLLPQILMERFDTSSPNGVVISRLFALFPGARTGKLRAMIEEKPDAMTFCILAEALRGDKKYEEATAAALSAIDAPTLYPSIRPYACAFAAVLLAERKFYVDDADDQKEFIARANELVRRRLTMGPLSHYATCQPLARIAEAAGDWTLLQQVVGKLEVHFEDDPEVLRSAMIAAYHQQEYLRAIELAEQCVEVLKDKKEINRAKNILKNSISAAEEKLKAARDLVPSGG